MRATDPKAARGTGGGSSDDAWCGRDGEARERGPTAADAFYLHERTPAGLRITLPTLPQSAAVVPSPRRRCPLRAPLPSTPPQSSAARTQSAVAAA
uniref:Uncharacterized protein n=1 Tax=Oryza rufipogon TaxID=4529 RepID=A0A0E0Q683_ORYRU